MQIEQNIANTLLGITLQSTDTFNDLDGTEHLILPIEPTLLDIPLNPEHAVEETIPNNINTIPDTPNTQPHIDFNVNHMFADMHQGSYTAEEQFSLSLLKILGNFGAPHYVYKQIMDIINQHLLNKCKNISSTFHSCSTSIQHFANRYSLNCMSPVLSTKTYEDLIYPVVTQNAIAMIASLLHDKKLFQDDNLLFPNPDDILGPLPPEPTYIGDIDTGNAF
jgi:hypothetical protein